MKKYFSLIFLLLACTLQGCVIVAAGAGAATTAAVVNDQRSVKTIADDQNIEFTAQKRITNDPSLRKNSHIIVVSFNHAVLLVGQVPSADVREQMQDTVQALPKVTRVYNELEVMPPTSAMVRSNDLWITTKVKTQMLGTKDLHSGQIKVVTENSSVYLMGIVTHSQATLAANVARQVVGVKRVVTLFEFTHGD